MGDTRTRAYSKGGLDSEDFAVSELSDRLERPDTVVWAGFADPTIDELHEVADELGLHELAVEDAVGPHQRAKLDHYATHLFLACHAVRLDLDEGELQSTEIDIFIQDDWLITVLKDDDFPYEAVFERWDRYTDLGSHGVSFLVYGLLDVIIDGYFDVVEVFDDYYDGISESIFSDHPLDPSEQRHWFQMRQSLVHFRRLVAPLREVVNGLMRREQSIVPEDLYPYYQDLYDHILRVNESTDALRDLVATIVDTNLGLRDYRQNQITKKVTGWAAIIAVPTLITGYFGMNVPFPGSGQPSGVVVSAVLVIVMSGLLYLIFRLRGWL